MYNNISNTNFFTVFFSRLDFLLLARRYVPHGYRDIKFSEINRNDPLANMDVVIPLSTGATLALGLPNVARLELLPVQLLSEEQGVTDPSQPCQDVVVLLHVAAVPGHLVWHLEDLC